MKFGMGLLYVRHAGSDAEPLPLQCILAVCFVGREVPGAEKCASSVQVRSLEQYSTVFSFFDTGRLKWQRLINFAQEISVLCLSFPWPALQTTEHFKDCLRLRLKTPGNRIATVFVGTGHAIDWQSTHSTTNRESSHQNKMAFFRGVL